MPHHVYANGREIASKSADGVSLGAFPDVCYSPPGDDTGTPVPYPNSCLARDITNGSRTVFIQGMEIALEDWSYFARSYGDEAATHALKKGINSGNIQGRCYFASWSFDVKVEGRGVARHMDIVTHNHGSPPNAGVQHYRSAWSNKSVCAEDRRDMDNRCRPETPADKQQRRRNNRGAFPFEKLGEVGERMGSATNGATGRRTRDNAWLHDHCDFLGIKPATGREGFEDFTRQIRELPETLTRELLEPVEQLSSLLSQQLSEQLEERVTDAALRQAARSGVKKILGALSWFGGPLVAAAVNGALIAHDLYEASQTLEQVQEAFPELRRQIESVTRQAEQIARDITDVERILQRYSGDDAPERMASDFMSAAAELDPCIRARRCQRVPYDRTSRTKAQDGSGCCPGQTGHHLIYDTWVQDKGGCDKYSHGSAPTVCVEGVSQNHGSHGGIHDATDLLLEELQARGSLGPNGEMSYGDAKETALDAFQRRFPTSGCNRACLEAQLDAYYNTVCSNKDPSEPSLIAKTKNGQILRDSSDMGSGNEI